MDSTKKNHHCALQGGTSMKVSNLILSLCVLGALVALPVTASANCGCQSKCGSKCGSYSKCGGKCGNYHAYGKCGTGSRMAYNYDDRHAVAGYDETMRDDYVEMQGGDMGYGRARMDVDAARIAEYHNIFGGGHAVAGYTGSWRPWMAGGTWVTVNGNRVWATQDDFVWANNHWTWNDDNAATVYFEDPRFNMNSHSWSATWSPWADGGTWVNVNGQRVWANEDDFVWAGDHWAWADDDNAVINFDDDRFNIDAQDWGVNDIDVDRDRFDLDVDRDKLDLDTDTFKVPDKLEIK
jgi:hypothetical protein